MAEASCEVWFYHLERTQLDQALPELLEKTLARGWKALVRSPEAERLDHLDGWLWSFRDESFLPHGLADEPNAARQPVLLTGRDDSPNSAPLNGAEVLFLIDGAEPGELSPYQRCLILFDGRDPAAVAVARERWTRLKGLGHPVSYWRQGVERGWEKQA